jgi:hypothetical protein
MRDCKFVQGQQMLETRLFLVYEECQIQCDIKLQIISR